MQQFNEAQNHYSVYTLPRALGVAIRTFDAWMIADEQALSQILGYTTRRQSAPENLTDAKSVCRNLLGNSKNSMSQTKMYQALMEIVDTDVMKKRCPKRFAPFAERIENLSQS